MPYNLGIPSPTLGLCLVDKAEFGSQEDLFRGPWRSGLFSRSLALGVMLTALWLAIVSRDVWRHGRRPTDRAEAG